MTAALHVVTVLDSEGLDAALQALPSALPDDRLARHFQAWCAEQILHRFEAAHPGDARVRDQIAMLRNDSATDEERAAARDGAWAAAREAWDAGVAAPKDKPWYAPESAARVAAMDDVWIASWLATWTGDPAAARDLQARQLRLMLQEPGD